MNIKEIEIYTPTITLNKFLKWARIVETGGQAKMLIISGKVKVNGEREIRRHKVLKDGDIIEINGSSYKVVYRK
ncbi:MAG: RNA-binding S4 domain-containing protein [Dictyoglomus sp.]|nr:RNA-binding S4 domain-containing protein [Dictyoglomus sp.]MCX7942193.1 RNA-binding S4 domain-containing protein [Dictyoglomaceae bacterium]MDW8188656.1 RNA-binding S4 domain-containing protein [Dictyoglomus sp.]